MPWTLYWHDAHSRRYLAYELSPSDKPLFEHFFT